jgi:hypothetical protein
VTTSPDGAGRKALSGECAAANAAVLTELGLKSAALVWLDFERQAAGRRWRDER